jgi:hypothetical protein
VIHAVFPLVWSNRNRVPSGELITAPSLKEVVALALKVGFRTNVHGYWVAFCTRSWCASDQGEDGGKNVSNQHCVIFRVSSEYLGSCVYSRKRYGKL